MMASPCERVSREEERNGHESRWEELDGELTKRVAPLYLLSALQTECQGNHYDLMYANPMVNNIEVVALVDIGATSVFIFEQIMAKLGLQVQQCPSCMKAVNSCS